MPTTFLVDCLNSPSEYELEKEIDDNYMYILPVITGIATREEVELATAHELSLFFFMALEKIKLMRGGL